MATNHQSWGEGRPFVRDGGRRDVRCVSGSDVVGGEAQWRRGPLPKSGATRSYYLLCLPRTGKQRTLSVAEAEVKMEVGANIEEVNEYKIKDKRRS